MVTPEKQPRIRLSDVHPELRRAYWFMRTVPVGRPWFLELAGRAMPLTPDPKPQAGIRFEKVGFGLASGARVYTPAGGGSGGAVLWIHGGGMVLGAASQDDRRCFELARELDVVVVSAEYRLAPQHPFPAALDDCRAAWQWLQEHAPNRWIDPARVAVGGQSAGGGLAASLVQRLHDEGGVQPVAQWLFCPMLDDRTAANRDLDAVRHILWNNAANRVGWRAYLGVQPGALTVPEHAVPGRRADVSGLPPTWIGTGDIELFHDENVRYADALCDAGVDCVLDLVAGAPHAFESLVPTADVSRAYRTRSVEWLRAHLSRESS